MVCTHMARLSGTSVGAHPKRGDKMYIKSTVKPLHKLSLVSLYALQSSSGEHSFSFGCVFHSPLSKVHVRSKSQ